MRNHSMPVIAGLLAVAFWVAAPAWGKTHSFTLHRTATINGSQLQPGTYKLELTDSGEAIIYQRGEKVADARVKVKPLPNTFPPRSVFYAADGSIQEIRLKKQLVVFVPVKGEQASEGG